MNILETFYILFKSNGSEVKKAAGEAQKATENLEKQQKKTAEETEKLGKAFVKMVENGTAAVTAVLSFGAIKSGVLNAEKLNSSLDVQSKLMAQNVTAMKAYAAATQAAGGTTEGFLSTLNAAFSKAAEARIGLPDVETLIRRYRDAVRGLSPKDSEFVFQKLGVADPGLKSLLRQSDGEFEKNIAAAKEHARITDEDAMAARGFEKAWAEASQSLDRGFTHLGNDLFPLITPLLNQFSAFIENLTQHKGGVEVFFVTAAAGLAALTSGLVGFIATRAGVLGLAGAFQTLAISITRVLAPLLAAWEIGKGIKDISAGSRDSFIGQGASAVSDWLLGFDKTGSTYRGARTASGATPATGIAAQSQKESYDFWIKQGYTPAAAAGLVANEKAESGFNPAAVGDRGAAHGSFQWHADRRAAILAATGIDVSSASHADQLRAAAWELNSTGIGQRVNSASSAQDAAAMVSRLFERPAGGAAEAMRRAQIAAQIASSTISSAGGPSLFSVPGAAGGGRNLSVKIDEVNVHTQATDAAGIANDIGNELKRQFRNTVSNYDDGVAY